MNCILLPSDALSSCRQADTSCWPTFSISRLLRTGECIARMLWFARVGVCSDPCGLIWGTVTSCIALICPGNGSHWYGDEAQLEAAEHGSMASSPPHGIPEPSAKMMYVHYPRD